MPSTHFLNCCFNNTVTPLQKTPRDSSTPDDICGLLCPEEEVVGIFRPLDTTKANGSDGISARMLKSTDTAIAPSLTKFIVQSVNLTVTFWKEAIIVPVPKKQGPLSPGPYPFFQSSCSNVLEQHIHFLITEHICNHTPLSNFQFGFQHRKSTVSALLSVTHDWLMYLEKRREVGVVFLISERCLTVFCIGL